MINHKVLILRNSVPYFYGKLGQNCCKTINRISLNHQNQNLQNCGLGYHIMLLGFLTEFRIWFFYNPGQIFHRFRNKILEWRFWWYPRKNSYRILRCVFVKRYVEFSHFPSQSFHIILGCDEILSGILITSLTDSKIKFRAGVSTILELTKYWKQKSGSSGAF